MRSPQEVLEATDWAGLWHAYGDAGDAPQMLTLVVSGDPVQCGRALGYLDAAVLHQGSLSAAAAPAAEFVAGTLAHPATAIGCGSSLPWDDRRRPMRAALLGWLASFAGSALYEELDPDWDEETRALMTSTIAACRAVLPDVYRQVLPVLDDPHPEVRIQAGYACAHLLLAPELAGERTGWRDRLIQVVERAGPTERAMAAVSIDAAGLAARPLLADPDPDVRACAAAAHALDGDPAALMELRAALRDPTSAQAWARYNRLPVSFGLNELVCALLRRTSGFAAVADEAVVLAGLPGPALTTALTEVLARAYPPSGGTHLQLSADQRRFLAALLANDKHWADLQPPQDHLVYHNQHGNLLSAGGLPASRIELRRMLRT